MHETIVAWNIIDKVRKRISQLTEPVQVEKVFVKVGEFTNVDPESLKFAYDSMRVSFQPCRASSLELEQVKSMAVCKGEEHTYHAQPSNSFRCPECGAGMKRLVTGEELEIVDIELSVFEKGEMPDHAWANY